jgi:hypothetical protein
MENNFDAVDMVRSIRDKIYEEIKNMDEQSLVAYLNAEGRKADEELRRSAGTISGGTLRKK